MPDLVAFNRRVHERIDPWFERHWVRRAGMGRASPASLLFAVVWLYFATGLPSSEKLLAYQPPLPTNVRGYDGNPVQTFARERRVELAYDEYPPLVVHAFISAEDKTFFSHGGIDYPGLVGAVFDYTTKIGQRRPRQGRLDHHPAGRQDICFRTTSYSVSRKIREAILAFRLEIDADQAADPRALPQLRSSSAATPMACRPRAAPISTRTSAS